jgi:hypothetical protein
MIIIKIGGLNFNISGNKYTNILRPPCGEDKMAKILFSKEFPFLII